MRWMMAKATYLGSRQTWWADYTFVVTQPIVLQRMKVLILREESCAVTARKERIVTLTNSVFYLGYLYV